MFSFVGKPNSGKGTLIRSLIEHYKRYKIDVISARDLIYSVDYTTPIGREIEKALAKGEFIPQEFFVELIQNELRKNKADVVYLDGVTRTIQSAIPHGKQGEFPIDSLVSLNASDDLCMARANNRIICNDCHDTYHKGQIVDSKAGRLIMNVGSDCLKCDGTLEQRTDDALIGRRLEIYNREIAPVFDFYKNEGINILDLDVTPTKTNGELKDEAVNHFAKEYSL